MARRWKRRRARRDAADPQPRDGRRQPRPAAALLVLPQRRPTLLAEGRRRSATRLEGENKYHAIFGNEICCDRAPEQPRAAAVDARRHRPRDERGRRAEDRRPRHREVLGRARGGHHARDRAQARPGHHGRELQGAGPGTGTSYRRDEREGVVRLGARRRPRAASRSKAGTSRTRASSCRASPRCRCVSRRSRR